MSGIAGIIHFDGAPVEPGQIESMTAAMAYRGPDGISHWAKGSVALGQCMLRTTPESLEEAQPLANEDQSLVLVMDGRVDNWEELRKELLGRGAVLRTRADAELVLRAYEVWDRDCVAHIDGDFALVIWDARKEKVFCARDRLGNKPFYYHWDGKTFAFGSELHPILALPWVEGVPNEGMLAEIIADEWYSRDETLWRGILRLIAGHWMEVDALCPRTKQYWEPDYREILPFQKDEEYIEYYRELFTDTVRRLSRSHRPVTYAVSGGLDSSAILSVALQLQHAGKLPAPDINAFTLAFQDSGEDSDLSYARALAAQLNIRIHEIPPSVMPLGWFSERARIVRDFPGYPIGSAYRSLLQQVSVTQGVVLLTGAGGDQWLQGSRIYYADELAAANWKKLWGCLKSDEEAFGMRRAAWWLMRYGVIPLLPAQIKTPLRYIAQSVHRKPVRNAFWLSQRMQTILNFRREAFKSHGVEGVRTRGQRVLLSTLRYAFDSYGAELAENFSSGFGLETRHPFQTAKFVQLAFSTPERMRLHGGRQKYIHFRALQGVVPQKIIDRQGKGDGASFVDGYLVQMGETFVDITKNRADWLDKSGMQRLLESYRNQPELGWQNWALWSIYACDQALAK